MRRSALAYICISLTAAAVRAGDIPLDPARVATLELEAGLASRPAIYLLLDPQRRVLEIKARGAVLDTVPLPGIEVMSQQSLLSRHPATNPPIPTVWTVKYGPGDTDREVVAPEKLVPAPKDDEDQDVEPTPPPGATPTPTPTPIPLPATSYRTRLTNGWDLWITDRLPPQDRLGARLRHFLDFHSARGAGHEYGRAHRAVNQDAQVKLALDVQSLFDQQPPDDAPFLARLRRHQLHSQHAFGHLGGFLGGSCQLHASRFAAASRVNLRLYDDDRSPQPLGHGARFVLLEGHFSARHGNGELGQNGLGLVFVNLHCASISARICVQRKRSSLLATRKRGKRS